MNHELINKIIDFRDARNWKQFHKPKDLAISISIEAAELLENFQWLDSNNEVEDKKDAIADEIADVLIYTIYLCDELNLDIDEIIEKKIEKNDKKYPVNKSFGNKSKYTDLGDAEY